MGSATKTVSYRYDAARNRTLMIDPEGGRTTYAYDALDRLISLINPQGERTTYAYDPKGRRTVKELANGTRASFTYDAANRLTTLANLRSDNTVISKFDYKYDKVGNRTEVVEADGSRVTWSYDPTSQLTAEHRTGSVPYRNTFTYDSVGNRLVKNESGARTTYSYDAANQLKTSIDAGGITTFTFDNNGNQHLVQTPNNDHTTTVWDYENKASLVELPSGLRNTMAYEPDGLRVKLEDSSGTKKFIWDHQNYLAESDENNDINVLYTNEPAYYGNLISQHRKSGPLWTPSYYHYEALGSTRELTNNTEAITDQYLYDAWGNVISSSGSTPNPFQFTGNVGYYFDVDTENLYIRARIYSPLIGRWLSIDPIGFVGGMNYYEAHFIPNRIDPLGLYQQQNAPQILPPPIYPQPDPDGTIDFGEALNMCDTITAALRNPNHNVYKDPMAKLAINCNVNIFCGNCGKNGKGEALSGLAFGVDGYMHICINGDIDWPDDKSKFAESIKKLEGLILHELVHAGRRINDNPGLCPGVPCKNKTPKPPGLGNPPRNDKNCNDCKKNETEAYTSQANYLFPNNADKQAEFIKVGICFSCSHVCEDFNGQPCGQFPS